MMRTYKINEIIAGYQENYLLNGMFLIAQNDEIIFKRNIGFADIENKKLFSEKTIFPVASITKQITATAILLLQEEGKLKVSDLVQEYFPANHIIWEGKPPSWLDKITIHHLLTHTSGIVSYTEMNGWEKLKLADYKDIIPTIISHVKNEPLEFEPGSKFSYNNTGFLLLGMIIEKFSKTKNVTEHFKEKIFSPLKMSDTFIPNIEFEKKYLDDFNFNENYPSRYTAKIDDKLSPIKKIESSSSHLPYSSSGAIFSTASNLLKWNNALYGGKLLSNNSLKALLTPYISTDSDFFNNAQSGYGIKINEFHDGKLYKHGGWIEGIRTDLSYNPENKVSIIILTNMSPFEDQSEELMEAQVKSLTDLGVNLHEVFYDV